MAATYSNNSTTAPNPLAEETVGPLLKAYEEVIAVPADTLPQRSLGPVWLPPLVLLAAIALSLHVFIWFCDHSRQLWWWMGHDRHAHYLHGLNLALDLKTGDFSRLVHDFDRMRVWGPFHAVMVALLELALGPDHRLAVLPSTVGWVMAIWFAFLIPRRMLPSGGNAAGLLAAFLVAVSPAHRAYATDVMYESLGAGLSLAALYAYLVVVQEGSRRAAIALGLTLTILFLHKYNYWLLVLFGMVFGEFVRQPGAWLCQVRALCRRDRLPRWLGDALKHPLIQAALAFAGAALYVAITGGGTVWLAGQPFSVQEPHNFVHLAYVMLFIRLVSWWRRIGKEWSRQLPVPLRDLLLWHGSAIALWFLLPKRLSYFLWYLSPAQTDQIRESVPFMHGIPYYLQAIQDDYLPLTWGIGLFAAMLLLGLLYFRSCKPGSAALFCFLFISVYLTCQHPMLKNRFLHSWIAMGWIIGAVGLVQAVQTIAGFLSPAGRPWAAAVACAVLIGMHTPHLLQPGHAQEGGIKTELPCPLVIPDTYLPHLADANEPTLFCNVSTRFLLSWTFIEQHHHQRFTADIKNYKASFENNPAQIQQWLRRTSSDTLVVIDIHPRTTFDWPTDEYVDLTALKQVLAQQTLFMAERRWELPAGVTITLWKKHGSLAGQSFCRALPNGARCCPESGRARLLPSPNPL